MGIFLSTPKAVTVGVEKYRIEPFSRDYNVNSIRGMQI